MNPSRIEQAIDEIYNYVEECKPSKLYPSKVVVDREQRLDEVFLQQLQTAGINSNKDFCNIFL